MDMEQRNQMIERLKAACPEYTDMSRLHFAGSGKKSRKGNASICSCSRG